LSASIRASSCASNQDGLLRISWAVRRQLIEAVEQHRQRLSE
jgi:hypothetical protein